MLDISGVLRKGFHDLLIKLHLESLVIARSMTKHEFVLPICEKLTANRLDDHASTIQLGILPNKDDTVSVRPSHTFYAERIEQIGSDMHQFRMHLIPPPINMTLLKQYALRSFGDAVRIYSSHIRDPIGGSASFLFVYAHISHCYTHRRENIS